jgi:hypothetical protein
MLVCSISVPLLRSLYRHIHPGFLMCTQSKRGCLIIVWLWNLSLLCTLNQRQPSLDSSIVTVESQSTLHTEATVTGHTWYILTHTVGPGATVCVKERLPHCVWLWNLSLLCTLKQPSLDTHGIYCRPRGFNTTDRLSSSHRRRRGCTVAQWLGPLPKVAFLGMIVHTFTKVVYVVWKIVTHFARNQSQRKF